MNALFAQLEAKNKEFQAIVAVAQERDKWDVPYEIIFSDAGIVAVRKILKELNLNFEYYDPDAGEQEDVLAYTNALNSFVADCRPFFEAVSGENADESIRLVLHALPPLLRMLLKTPEYLTLNVIPKRDGAGKLYAYEFAFFPGDGVTIRHVIPMEG